MAAWTLFLLLLLLLFLLPFLLLRFGVAVVAFVAFVAFVVVVVVPDNQFVRKKMGLIYVYIGVYIFSKFLLRTIASELSNAKSRKQSCNPAISSNRSPNGSL